MRNFVVEHVPAEWATAYPDANFLKVVGSLEALQRLAERHRDSFDIPIVGITGSNGKTIVKEWLYQLLSPSKAVTRSPRSYNSQIGVPLSVWLLEQSQVGLFEAGISKPGEMAALRDIIQPTIAVLTNLGTAHQENFSSMDEKCEEKLKLFHDAKVAVYCEDDPVVAGCVARLRFPGELVAWSRNDEKAPLYVSEVKKQSDATVVTYIYKRYRRKLCTPLHRRRFHRKFHLVCCRGPAVGLSTDSLAEGMKQLESWP